MKLFSRNHFHLLGISSAILLIHLYNNAFTTYGYFRDELYYIACSEHLSFGFVDQPPLCALILWFNRSLFGDSVFAMRLLPSLANALTIFFTGIFVKKFGGDTFAQILACVAVGFAPGLVGMFGIYTMNVFDILFWQVALYLLLNLFETQDPKYWYWIGVVIGIGLLNKVSMGWIAAGISLGIIVTPERLWLKTKYPYIAAGISFLLFLPYIIWNLQHDLAHLEFIRNASGVKYASQNIGTFLTGIVLNYNPLAMPIWIAGFWFFFSTGKKELRTIGVAILTVLTILFVNIHSKAEYFNPAMPVLIAGGAVLWQKWLTGKWRRVAGYVHIAIIMISGIIFLPMAIDIVPVETYIRYSRAFGFVPATSEGHRMRELPQHFADRFGWEEMAKTTANVFKTLPAEEQKFTTIFVQNYGDAGAIDFFGQTLGLPKAISGHNSYWWWGVDRLGDSVTTAITIGGDPEDYQDVFQDVTLAAVHSHSYAMAYESDLPIYICRTMKVPIASVWEKTRHYD